MSYRKKTIEKVITEIYQKKIYLPAIQRKFVWGKHQIGLLFDSLMRNYPFGTFLFWQLDCQKAESYVFYDFLLEYDEREPYNRRKTGAFLHPEIIGVLDGQQRLSSLFIGLMGTHTEKTPYARKFNPSAYEKTCLYLNLLSLPYTISEKDEVVTIEEQNFEFRFLTEDGATSNVTRKVEGENGAVPREESMLWMKVGQVLSWGKDPEFDRIIDKFRAQCQNEAQEVGINKQRRLMRRGLEILHTRICKDELINYFEVAKDDLEDILKIFVRVNSGGTVLNKTDLLFSTIVATWNDGREQIEKLLKSINKKGNKFNFGNEYLMRCCLVLSDGPVVYKVDSFKSENVQRIQDEWPKIAEAVTKTVDLLVEFGFSDSVLTSQNATIIIAYYLYKGGDQSKESKDGIQKYLIHALLNGIYGSSQEQLIATFRSSFREEVKSESGGIVYKGRHRSFSFQEVLKIDLPQQKSLAVTESDIERFLQSTKGPSSFFILSLLYPQLRYSEVEFHQDHIHPESGFTESNFREIAIPEEEWKEWWNCRDCVPNLQLMEGRLNESKNATPLKRWVEQMDDSGRTAFFGSNYFPENVDLAFKDFMIFFKRRKERLRKELKKVLALTSEKPSTLPVDWSDRDDEIESQKDRIVTGASE